MGNPVRDFARRIRCSSLWLQSRVWLVNFVAHPWTRACRIALFHAFAFLIGEPFEDDLVAFSASRLMVNDSYRDRLLAPEIHELVDLWDALQLSIPQRKAFFRCFLHLDAMRRAGVARSELLRYCGLRDTPTVRHFLPSEGAFAVAASTHRSKEFRTQRWDITQLLAVLFSLCTMDLETMIRQCVQQITDQFRSTDQMANDKDTEEEAAETAPSVEERLAIDDHGCLTRQITACLTFNFGAPSPVEHKLGEFLCRLYTHRLSGSSDFMAIHDVTSLLDVIKLFPVLVFPCVWTQHVIKRRILGEATWSKLSTRRAELHLAGLHDGFVSCSDITDAAKVLVSKKKRPRPWEKHNPQKETNEDHEQRLSQATTPRKVLPVDEMTTDQEQLLRSAQHASTSFFAALHNEDDAWRVTADSALASALVWHDNATASESGAPSTVVTAETFCQIRKQIEATTLPKDSVEKVRRLLIQVYGYQFTTFLFAKSSLGDRGGGDLVCTESVRKEERRAKQRYQKADSGLALVEDRAIYWKEYTDLSLKRVFYHNIRTGESRWEIPTTLVKQRRKHRKKVKRSPMKSDLL